MKQSKDTITEIHGMDKNGDIQHVYNTQEEIMKELKRHYTELYKTQKTNPEARKLFTERINVQITDEQKAKLEKPITIEELTASFSVLL